MSFNQWGNPCKRCALAHWETPVVSYWKHGSSDHFPCSLGIQRGLHCVILLSTLCFHYGRVVVQISKCNFQKHAVAPWRRQMWKEDSLHLQPRHPAGLSPALSRRPWVPSCLPGEVRAPRNSFAVLLLFCFITLMCALSMPFHSRAHSLIQKLI